MLTATVTKPHLKSFKVYCCVSLLERTTVRTSILFEFPIEFGEHLS